MDMLNGFVRTIPARKIMDSMIPRPLDYRLVSQPLPITHINNFGHPKLNQASRRAQA